MRHASRSQTISFRASEDLARLIDRERAPFELSRGTFVRGLVSGQLLATQQQEQTARLEELHRQIETLAAALERGRREQRKSLFLILTRIGGIEGAEAKQMLRDFFGVDSHRP